MNAQLAGTPRYFAWLYSDARMQAILEPLFGIEAEIAASLQPGLEHSVAHVRVGWWAEEAQRLRGGHALHPLTRALLAQRPAASAMADISGLTDVATWDLAAATFETRADLAAYCDRWARAVPQLAAAWVAPDLPAQVPQQFGYAVGVALCELDMLIHLERSARRGRLRVPLEELGALGVAPEALAHPPWPAALCARLRTRHQELRATLTASCGVLQAPGHRAALRGLLVWAAVMLQHSRRAQRALPRSWQRSRWNGIGDSLGAWRAARRALHARSNETQFAEHP
ncbi:MAG TPA: squalene/phytoene synthase family protein [Steroidobacteraceae bacterium]|nr:squalene/phytoene synthase family protein [Steroidobacteraceae bacterium]